MHPRPSGEKGVFSNYPIARSVPLRRLLQTPDLYKAGVFFFSMQFIIALVPTGGGGGDSGLAKIASLVALVIGSLTAVLAIRTINKRQVRKNTTFHLSSVWIIAGAMIATLFVATYILNTIGVSMPRQPNQTNLIEIFAQSPLVMVLTVMVVAPLTEEVVFRELLPRAMGASYLSFAISSLIFVALHSPFGVMGWISYSILSFGFLYARLKDDNIWTAVIVHMVWNTLSVTLQFL